MRLPKMQEIPQNREMISAFGGYNHHMRIGEGEFYDMTNLTSDEYPNLSPRKRRGIYASLANPVCMLAKEKLCYIDGDYLYIGEAYDFEEYKGRRLDAELTDKLTEDIF